MYFAAATARLRFALLDYTATFREVSKQRYKTCPPQLLAVGSWLLSVVELGSCNRQQPTTNDLQRCLFILSGRRGSPPSILHFTYNTSSPVKRVSQWLPNTTAIAQQALAFCFGALCDPINAR
mmetsp:Transcript_4489/g.9331  ORF Transcript_4489/g.9331 Transcript_4489/m.9331 type:complete len:123 (+) Transcript_4489:404-772(+)